jgi:hypothetical protein
LAKAFVFYEKMVQEGKIRSYGITADQSIRVADLNSEKKKKEFKKF